MLIIKEDQTIFPEKPLKYQKYEYQKIQMLDTFQAVRYGFYRKSDFKKEKIKKIIVNLNPFLKNINFSQKNGKLFRFLDFP